MIAFPNAKLNIGLHVVSKREDGYHNLETLFYPIPLHDALEINQSDTFSLDTGEALKECPVEKNLVTRAYRAMEERFHLPPVRIVLRKQIPYGGGLGGGSSDAAQTLRLLNSLFELNCSHETLVEIGSKLGADVPCFLYDSPTYGEGIGDILTPYPEVLKGYHLVLVIPGIKVSTTEAYANVKPKKPEVSLKELLQQPVERWRGSVWNQFETSLFEQHPELGEIKERLYQEGALYASMSGSGSTIYGLWKEKPNPIELPYQTEQLTL